MRQAEREDLLAQQASALSALTSTNSCSNPFGGRGLAAAREALVRKRVGSLARSWPDLSLALGDGFRDRAREYVLTNPRLTPDARVDGRAFAAWLEERESLPLDAVVEVLRFDATYVVTASGVRHRRVPWLVVRRRRRFMAAASFPRLGPRPSLAGVLGVSFRTRASRRLPPAP